MKWQAAQASVPLNTAHRAIRRRRTLRRCPTGERKPLDEIRCGALAHRLADWCAVDLLEDKEFNRLCVIQRDNLPGQRTVLHESLLGAPEARQDPLGRVLQGAGSLLLDEASCDRPNSESGVRSWRFPRVRTA
ncbi:hypothetical protein AB0E00_00650 [Streptomyces sp. NPDC048110]|uniref:hypothetical protein n=1 Tax=Streptomyces sp. NPDC048110 TaxID=3155483 RepID=UPI0033E4E771